MKRLGVWLPRWNHLKTLLPVMREADCRGIRVSVLCPFPPLTGEGKPELLAATVVDSALRPAFPWAEWSILKQAPGSWPVDAMIAHGVVHDADIIRKSGIPWVAVDHLHENAWWYLTGREHLWEPWHRVCFSGIERDYFPVLDWPTAAKIERTGYTALDGPHDTPAEIRKAYGLPDRYLLVGTAVHASTIPWGDWQGYFRGGVWKGLGSYRGPSYKRILTVLRDFARGTGMALVGKGRWKHEAHRAHRIFDHYFDDEPTDPGRALRLMQGAAMYAGGISGLAVEALAAGTPTVNWTYYDPPIADHPGFRRLREDLWIDGIWQAPGIGALYRVYDPTHWQEMIRMLDTVGPHFYHHVPSSYATRIKAVGSGGSSAKVLEACGL
jgi:hypothetical protein